MTPDEVLIAIIVGALLASIPFIVATYKMFEKAGEPGISCIVPVWNIFVMCRIAGAPSYWAILMLIPLVNAVVFVFICIGIADNFHKSKAFGIGLAFLPFIFNCILGFGNATYRKDKVYF